MMARNGALCAPRVGMRLWARMSPAPASRFLEDDSVFRGVIPGHHFLVTGLSTRSMTLFTYRGFLPFTTLNFRPHVGQGGTKYSSSCGASIRWSHLQRQATWLPSPRP